MAVSSPQDIEKMDTTESKKALLALKRLVDLYRMGDKYGELFIRSYKLAKQDKGGEK